ncbi:hypothetical protein HNQ02_003780 [Flavobacterium sp. 7E]|nr:hypothetical protein [Flavobacterium sp. PL002]NRS90833.1 hypothetical protein [Flavobacterium sp. 7E]
MGFYDLDLKIYEPFYERFTEIGYIEFLLESTNLFLILSKVIPMFSEYPYYILAEGSSFI